MNTVDIILSYLLQLASQNDIRKGIFFQLIIKAFTVISALIVITLSGLETLCLLLLDRICYKRFYQHNFHLRVEQKKHIKI